jgi:hypothetical protein
MHREVLGGPFLQAQTVDCEAGAAPSQWTTVSATQSLLIAGENKSQIEPPLPRSALRKGVKHHPTEQSPQLVEDLMHQAEWIVNLLLRR